MTALPGIAVKRNLGRSRIFLRGWVAGAACVALFLLFSAVVYFSKPASRHNTVQTIAAVFFAITVISQLFPSRRLAPGPEGELPAESAGSRKGLLWALAAGALAYASTLSFFFVSDDYTQLRKAAAPFFTNVWQYATKGQLDAQGFHLFYRPLGFASLFLEYRIWHLWAPGYHLNNLFWHLLAIAGLFLFCEKLGLDRRTCTTAALLFALMPVNAEVVTWTGCRFDRLATVFMLWSSFFYVWFRQNRKLSRYVVALLLFVLAAVSKETAYVLPIVWLALDFLVLKGPRLKPILGYLAVSAVCFLWRLHVLGGIGGYRMGNGAPAALHVTKAALVAILFREPAALLFGYNWLQPSGIFLMIVAAATAAIVFTLVSRGERTSRWRRLIFFTLAWIFAAGLPAHFLFWNSDVGLTYSRVLYYGSAGVALLLALQLGKAFRHKRLQRFWTGALACVFALALFHNLGAWRWNSDVSRNFLAELKEIVPSPPSHSRFLIENMPMNVRGVPFFEIGLIESVQFDYGGRGDIYTSRVSHFPAGNDPRLIRLRWTGDSATPLERVR